MHAPEPRSRLVSKEEMGRGFANLTPTLDDGFRKHITQYAGYEAGPQELAMLLVDAIGNRLDKSSRFNLTEIIDIVAGEQGKALSHATKKVFERIAEISAGTPRS